MGKTELVSYFILCKKEITWRKKLMNENKQLDEQFEIGVAVGINLMKEKLLLAAENGTPIEINGRAWWLKSDIENLRDIFEDIKNGGL